jgi:hypothetical protein
MNGLMLKEYQKQGESQAAMKSLSCLSSLTRPADADLRMPPY